MISITTCLQLVHQVPTLNAHGNYAYVVSPVHPLAPGPFFEIHLSPSTGANLILGQWLNFVGQLHTTWHGPSGKNMVIIVENGNWDMTDQPVLEPSPWLHIHGCLKIAETGIPTVGYNPSSECGTSYIMHSNAQLASRRQEPLYRGYLVSFEGLLFGRGNRKLHLSLSTYNVIRTNYPAHSYNLRPQPYPGI
ncbi:hypothetical protein MJO29_005327 [Puccinia striiformis f. sp. tritici]|nr:hypothetical protein MJO29_005327 [Puccinia striiformis f. sp. tritici]